MLAAVGQPVPNTEHAVSVSLPSWKATVGYEEGEDWVVSKMKTGYPRFFIHLSIQELQSELLKLHGKPGEAVMLWPTLIVAKRCQKFFYDKLPSLSPDLVHVLGLEPVINKQRSQETISSGLAAVFFPKEHFSTAKQVWQHTGDGISSRRAEFCLKALRDGFLKPAASTPTTPKIEDLYTKGPRRYQRPASQQANNPSPLTTTPPSTSNNSEPSSQEKATVEPELKDYAQFVEERFGRNLNAKLALQAKLAIRRRISGCLKEDSDLDHALATSSNNCDSRQKGLRDTDVFLFPCGMSAIFNTHRILLQLGQQTYGDQPARQKSICFGFPYIDTLKILQKWGPGCQFYGFGNSDEIDDLQRRLEGGERFLALFCEFPSNPLLNSPDLLRLRGLADQYEFAIVVDETVGNFININVLTHADVVVSSLTKLFSGDSNVMGGSMVLNPQSRYYERLTRLLSQGDVYEDTYWAEDAVFMERNSRDFISRSHRINHNTSTVTAVLEKSPLVKHVYYPRTSPTRANYDACRHPQGGYGGLFSVTFNHPEQAVTFFDRLEVQKGPSLGTNFTLACPYTILAHYLELDFTSRWGVEPDLVRVSVGLEETSELVSVVEAALAEAAKIVV